MAMRRWTFDVPAPQHVGQTAPVCPYGQIASNISTSMSGPVVWGPCHPWLTPASFAVVPGAMTLTPPGSMLYTPTLPRGAYWGPPVPGLTPGMVIAGDLSDSTVTGDVSVGQDPTGAAIPPTQFVYEPSTYTQGDVIAPDTITLSWTDAAGKAQTTVVTLVNPVPLMPKALSTPVLLGAGLGAGGLAVLLGAGWPLAVGLAAAATVGLWWRYNLPSVGLM